MPKKRFEFALSLLVFLFFITALSAQETQVSEDTGKFEAFQHEITENDLSVNYFPIVVKKVPVNFTISLLNKELKKDMHYEHIPVWINDSLVDLKFINGIAKFKHSFHEKEVISIKAGSFSFEDEVNPIPLWLSILPPLIAIFMALVIREVYSSLFTGILIGTTIIFYYQGNTFFTALFKGLFSIADTYILDSISDKGHLSIIIFTMVIGAMVGLITRNGGMKGVVNILSRYARSPRSGQLVTWLLGVVIFFDDYANTLVVGNTMRPVTDRLKISREKLAYIVDSTAAPIAAVAFVTTWIGAELSYIQNGVNDIGLEENAYSIFFNSLAYSFYPIFTLIFIPMLVIRKVDYGPMLKAEKRARAGEIGKAHEHLNSEMISEEERNTLVEKGKARWFNAVIPVLVIILGTFAGLLFTGWDHQVWNDTGISYARKVSIIIGNSDSYLALLWSSLSGVIIALLLTLSQRILSLKDSVESLINGFKTMLTAVLILVLAWALALVTEHMHTADFISQSMLEIQLSPYFVPAITFILAALVSFSTGSSWGTMAILYPLLLPASWLIAEQSGLDYDASMLIFYNVVSCVLAGSVLGDHCSPISDTTILSSLASSCNHIEHVRTQLPYALSVGFVAIIVGTIPSAFGISSYILFSV
ncbi:MAG: Na+/H+ antiporter NhaC family protein, partial [Bacteroidales bacterium]|nr:Na+/H+ antiporter NhaC family protein [Bacteroidales bacterium]